MIRVLFVCLGNICRSPMAEAILRDKVKKANLENDIFVDSCAIGPWHVDCPPHKGTINQLKIHNIPYDDLFARMLNKKDGEHFDLIIAMDDDNISDIKDVIDHSNYHKVKKLLNYAGLSRDIRDPYLTGNFDETYEDVLLGCDKLFNELLQKTAVNEKNHNQ